VSGVSARNIRAYRERGLLDPPRRAGRSAFYSDHHVAQLHAISQLLHRGFSSAHIAEFIAGVRQGHDLAEILGLREAIFGGRQTRTPTPAAIDPGGPEALALRERGLAEVVDGELAFVNPTIGEIVSRADEQLAYVRVILRFSDATSGAIDVLAATIIETLRGAAVDRFGNAYLPVLDESIETVRRVVSDHRVLGDQVVADQLATAVQRHLTTALGVFTNDVLLGGNWNPPARSSG
jgi:DNA-binding transcriptional MerR regulator